MKYGSVCSGVEAATVAWHPLGWEPQWFSEIEKFPSAVLQHQYPDTPNYGDMRQFKEWLNDRSIDLLVGGTPCQSFSVAGLRKGLDDPRGNLMLTYLAIAAQYRPKWLVWENVPGVLSSNRGRDFGSFLGALGQCGYGFAYRVLDAQFYGVPQRRRRVFVIGYLGDWRRAAAVLFELESLSGHPAPSRKARQEVAETIAACSFSGGAGGRPDGAAVNHFVPELSNALCARDYKGARPEADQGAPVIAFGAQNSVAQVHSVSTKVTPTLDKSKTPAVAVSDSARTLSARHDSSPCSDRGQNFLAQASAVRRLTPIECERLQGFCDNYTQIPWRNKPAENCPDGPRYKAMGNSMAVPVMRWIGERIKMVEEITNTAA